MNNANIIFSNGDSLRLTDGDSIIPVLKFCLDSKQTASMGESISLINHIHNGLIPSIIEATSECRFFYLNHNFDVVYGTSTIVKIELV